MDIINNLIEQIPVGSSGTGSRVGKYEAMLDDSTQRVLAGFVEWLSTSKTKNTANSYKSYVAKALALGTAWSDLTSDQRSAVKKFAEYAGTLA